MRKLKEVMDYLREHCHSPIPSEKKVAKVLKFLEEYNFVEVFREDPDDPSTWSYNLSERIADWLKEIQKVE